MKKYKCHKVVEASKILGMSDEGGDLVVFVVEDKLPDGITNEAVEAPKNILSRYRPQEGDYLVKYEDGFLSISPGKVFEDGYSVIYPDYIQLMVSEKEIIESRLERLCAYIDESHDYQLTSDDEKNLLAEQVTIMQKYSDLLSKRISVFNG